MIGLDTWGLDMVLWFQDWRTTLIASVALVFNELGQFIPYLLLLPAFYWCVDRRFGARLAVWFVAGVWLNFTLKVAFGLPRPYFDPSNGVRNLVDEASAGLPSGHAQSAAMYWGVIGTKVGKGRVWVAIAVYVLLMGLSRIVLGVHYPQDVLAGWLIGAAWVALYARLDGMLFDWLDGWSLAAQLAAAVVIGVAVAALLPTEDGATFGGSMTGLGAGAALMGRRARFDAGGAWGRRVARYALGAVTLLVVYFGLRAAFGRLEPGLAWRFLRFVLVGGWVALGAPWLFLRAGLAEAVSLQVDKAS